ncbi:MAG: 2-phospho-L-lactate transferase CofD family protein, partial [Myxococcaceae bacterium]
GMNGTEHVKAVIDHVGPVVDVVLVNATAPSDELLEQYGKKGSVPVSFDRRKLLDLGVIPVEADLLKQGRHIRHDSGKVARCLLKLARNGL